MVFIMDGDTWSQGISSHDDIDQILTEFLFPVPKG